MVRRSGASTSLTRRNSAARLGRVALDGRADDMHEYRSAAFVNECNVLLRARRSGPLVDPIAPWLLTFGRSHPSTTRRGNLLARGALAIQRGRTGVSEKRTGCTFTCFQHEATRTVLAFVGEAVVISVEAGAGGDILPVGGSVRLTIAGARIA